MGHSTVGPGPAMGVPLTGRGGREWGSEVARRKQQQEGNGGKRNQTSFPWLLVLFTFNGWGRLPGSWNISEFGQEVVLQRKWVVNVLDEKRKGQGQGWLASTQGPHQPDGTWASLHSVQHFLSPALDFQVP